MPLTNPRTGAYTDLKTVIDTYTWRTSVRANNASVVPTVYQWTELGDRRGLQDPAIVIQTYILRGIEMSSGAVAIRARMGLVFHGAKICKSRVCRSCTCRNFGYPISLPCRWID